MFKQKLLSILVTMIVTMSVNAATYYSRTSGGNWTDNTSWSTVTYGNSTNSGTYPKSGDNAYIGDGYTIVINAACTTSYVFVGQGSSGILEYAETGNYSLVVINNITIATGGTFRYTGNSTRTHTLSIGNNLTNSGSMDLYSDANDVVNLTFYRAANSVVSGSGSFDLNAVNIQKLTSTTFTVDVQSTTFESGIRDFVLTYGTYHHNNSSTYNVNNGSSSNFTIPADGVIKVSSGTLHLSPTATDCILNGSITVSGGTLKIGESTGTGGLKYEKPGSFNPRLDIQSGELDIFGGLTYKAGASTSPLVFSISGGTLLLNIGSTGMAGPIFNINDVSGSSCTITDGYIILEKPNTTGSSVADAVICGTNGTVAVTSGVIQFGNSNTADGSIFNFSPISNITWPNIYVASPTGSAVSLQPSASNTADIKTISVHVDPNTTFDVRAISGTTGDTRKLTLTGNYDGINAILCDGDFNGRSGALSMEGGEGQQIGGNGTLSLNDLTVNNTSGFSLGMNVTVNGLLSLTDGVIYSSSAAILTIAETGTISGAGGNSYIDGPLVMRVASSGTTALNFPIGKNGAYRPVTLNVTHVSGASVDYQAEVISSNPRDLNFTLPGTIDKISGVRYLQIDRSGAANLTAAFIELTYDADDGVTDPSQLRLVQFDGSSAWEDIGGSGSAAVAGIITSSSFSNMSSKFALGNANGGGNPLPVTWLSFTAEKTENIVALTWATASEKNSDYFEVQRSINGTEFVSIGRTNAAGNSTSVTNYHLVDLAPVDGTLYYRIKQVDRDGQFSYSVTRVVNSVSDNDDLLIYPNPANNNLVNIISEVDWNGEVNVMLYDASGQLIHEHIQTGGSNLINISPVGIEPGIQAFVKLTDKSGHLQTGKLKF